MSPLSRSLAAAGLALAAAGPASAQPPPAWSYTVTPGPEIDYDTVEPIKDEGYLRAPGGKYVSAYMYFNLNSGSARGSTTVRAADLITVYTDFASPDNGGVRGGLGNLNDPYSLIFGIRDDLSGQFGAVTLTGWVAGTIGPDGNALTNVFTGPSSQSLVLGDTRYTVSAVGFTAPNDLGGPDVYIRGGGSIDVRVTAAVDTPEPGTLALAGVGLAAAGVRRLARRRQSPG